MGSFSRLTRDVVPAPEQDGSLEVPLVAEPMGHVLGRAATSS
jgi:hypothetical protein